MNRNNFFGKVFISNSFKETQRLGRDFAKTLKKGETTFLYGDLGSGKTTFVQGLAKGLGIKNRIISPTFVIVRQYKVSPPRSPFGHLGGGEATTSTPARCNTFHHIDLYRVGSARDIESLGLEEIMNNRNNIVVIEWAEKMGKLLPKKRIDVRFEYVDENKRNISIRNNL